MEFPTPTDKQRSMAVDFDVKHDGGRLYGSVIVAPLSDQAVHGWLRDLDGGDEVIECLQIRDPFRASRFAGERLTLIGSADETSAVYVLLFGLPLAQLDATIRAWTVLESLEAQSVLDFIVGLVAPGANLNVMRRPLH